MDESFFHSRNFHRWFPLSISRKSHLRNSTQTLVGRQGLPLTQLGSLHVFKARKGRNRLVHHAVCSTIGGNSAIRNVVTTEEAVQYSLRDDNEEAVRPLSRWSGRPKLDSPPQTTITPRR